MSIVYLNGQFIPQEEATISVLDRGFLFSDGVYEVIPAYSGRLLGLDEHLQRLAESLTHIRITPPLSHSEWKNILAELLTENNGHNNDQVIYIQISRGAETARHHAIPAAPQPTVFAFCSAHRFPALETLKKGFSAITLADRRRLDCHIKSTALLPNVLAYQDALDASAHEAILIRDNHAVEATSSNLFIVKNNTLITPPLSPSILAGVTRQLILKLAAENDIAHVEANITEAELHDADEIWLTGSKKEIYPIVTLDNRPVGDGKAGPVWQTVIALYQQQKESTPTLRKPHD